MKVLKAFDFYQPGDTMTPDAIGDQAQRGNLDDLIRNGFVEGPPKGDGKRERIEVQIAPDPLEDLRATAQAFEIKGWHNMKEATLIERIAEAQGADDGTG